MTGGTLKDTTVTRNRLSGKPVTWYPRPDSGQKTADIRREYPYGRWEKVPGYQRSQSWDEYSGKLPKEAHSGHTRKTWNGGYVRIRGVDPANVRRRDRFGYWTVLRVLHIAGVYRDGTWLIREDTRFICECECGTIRELGTSLLYGHSLSCGCWKAKNRIGHAQGCICETCVMACEIIRQLQDETGHAESCHCGDCSQLGKLAPLIPVILAFLAELYRTLKPFRKMPTVEAA